MKPIIDISKHQNPANIDYDKLGDEVSGVIIRCSYGSKFDSPFGKEPFFETHYNEFTKRGCMGLDLGLLALRRKYDAAIRN